MHCSAIWSRSKDLRYQMQSNGMLCFLKNNYFYIRDDGHVDVSGICICHKLSGQLEMHNFCHMPRGWSLILDERQWINKLKSPITLASFSMKLSVKNI